MRLRSGYENRRACVDMLPLIDVVFLLLVFFIYAVISMAGYPSLRVDLPVAETAALPEEEPFISIAIDAGSRFHLNAEPMELESLARCVRALYIQSPRLVFIEGDRKARLGPVIGLLDRLKKAGIEEISFSCKKETL